MKFEIVSAIFPNSSSQIDCFLGKTNVLKDLPPSKETIAKMEKYTELLKELEKSKLITHEGRYDQLGRVFVPKRSKHNIQSLSFHSHNTGVVCKSYMPSMTEILEYVISRKGNVFGERVVFGDVPRDY